MLSDSFPVPKRALALMRPRTADCGGPQLKPMLGGGTESELNWDAIGSIGEIIGALAVLVTLFYLAIQMRQNNQQIAENTRMARLSARGSLQQAFGNFRHLIASSPELAELYLKGCADFRSLSAADRLRFTNLLQDLSAAWDLQHLLVSNGLIDADRWERQMPARLAALRQPGVRDWWDRNKEFYDPTFVAAIDSALASGAQAVSSAAQQAAAAAEPLGGDR